jgi:lysophospholipase L1-like esterase
MDENASPIVAPSPEHARDAAGPDPERGDVGRRPRRRLLGVLLAISLTLNVLGLAYITARVARKGGMRYLLERLDLRNAEHPLQGFQADWRARLRKLPNTPGEIIFAGDSIMESGPWSEIYSPIKNRGIGGETTAGLLDRLDEITESHPQKVFLEIGTNDLAADLPTPQVVRNYRKILERIRRDSPETRIYVLSVTPVNQKIPGGPVHDNDTIRDLNRRLRELAGEFEGVTYIDAFDALTDANGDLRLDLTTDGVHLNLDAYLILGRLLENRVRDESRREPLGEARGGPVSAR